MSKLVKYSDFSTKTYDMGTIRFTVNKEIVYYKMLQNIFIPYARNAANNIGKIYFASKEADIFDRFYDSICDILDEPLHAAVQECLYLGYTDITEDNIWGHVSAYMNYLYDDFEEGIHKSSSRQIITTQLKKAAEAAVSYIPDYLYKYLTKNDKIPNSDKADELYDKILDYDLSDDQKKKFFIEMFSQNPYDIDYYTLYKQKFNGNEQKVDAVAAEFGVSNNANEYNMSNSYNEDTSETVFDFKKEVSTYFIKHPAEKWDGGSSRIPILDNNYLYYFEKHMREYCKKYGKDYDYTLKSTVQVTYKDGKTYRCNYNDLFENIYKYDKYNYSDAAKELKKNEMHNIYLACDVKNLNSINEAISKIKKIQSECSPEEWGGDYEIKRLQEYIEEIKKKEFYCKNNNIALEFISIFEGDKELAQLLCKNYFEDNSGKINGKYLFKIDFISEQNAAFTQKALKVLRDKYDISIRKPLEDECKDFLNSCDKYKNMDIAKVRKIAFLKLGGLVISLLASVAFLILLFTTFHFGFIIEAILYFALIGYIIFSGYTIGEIFSDFIYDNSNYKLYHKNSKH